MQKINHNFLSDTWKLTKLYWQSEEKWRSFLLLAAIIVLNLGSVGTLVWLNSWRNMFYTALQEYDTTAIINGIGYFTVIAFTNIVIVVYAFYLRQILEVKWRRWLTEYYMKNWLNKRAYYLMQLMHTNTSTDNPDQRISEDLKSFVSLTLSLSLGILNAVVTLVSFIVVLWNLSGVLMVPVGENQYPIYGYMVWVSILYAVVGNWLTVKIGRPLVALNFNQQRYEADFRFGLVRLRENSESIAFYGGEVREENNFAKRFKPVVENFIAVIKRQKKLTWFVSGYSQLSIIVPIVMAIPRYLSHQIALGGLMQTLEAFRHVQDSLSYFVGNYSTLAEWQAVVNRLLGFIENVNSVQNIAENQQVQTEDTVKQVFAVEGLDVCLPKGECLLNNLELTLVPGDSLLITGPSGCGKSTLLRALAGIWPFGCGKITRSLEFSALFLPQKSYLPLSTLRNILLYPCGENSTTDDFLKKILTLCKLENLINQLDTEENWSHILSLGEQQRIAFARAIIQRPDWLFLDEATSALDESTEKELYALLKSELKDSAIISIGHRNTLTKYHKTKLTFQKEGNWSLQKTSESESVG